MGRRGAIAIAAFSMFLSGCGPSSDEKSAPEESRTPDQIVVDQVAHVDGVDHAQRENGDLIVNAKIESGDGSLYVPDMLKIVQDVGAALRRADDKAKPPAEVVVDFSGPTVDRLGHESVDPLVKMFFPESDLTAANFDNLTMARQADLARTYVVEAGAGAQAVLAFCTSEFGAGSVTFCKP